MSKQPSSQDSFAPADDAIARYREELKKRFPLPPPAKKSGRQKKTTAGIALVAALGLLGWLDPAYKTEHFESGIAQHNVVELEDGSVVVLDGASRLTVSWHLRSRRVELRAGQALFSVAPRVYRPFITTVGSTEIRVVGTRYNVSRLQDDVRVTVQEGKVAVRGNDADVLLTPGTQVMVRSGQIERPTPVDAENVVAWTSGRLMFDRAPLREVLAVVQRNKPITIRIDDRNIEELPVSGAFDGSRLESLLALLPKVLPVDIAQDEEGVLHVRERAAKK